MSRVLESLLLTSPSGIVHTVSWIGDSYGVSKKVAVFEYPDVDGAGTVDLGISSEQVPLTFYFSGENHADLAINFEVALKERGSWSVTHPVLGILQLQPLSAKFDVEPVKSGNVTKVSSTWIKYLPRYTGVVLSQYESVIKKKRAEIISSIYETNLPEITSEESRNNFINTIKNVVSTVKSLYRKFYQLTGTARKMISKVLSSIDMLLIAPYTAVSSVLGLVNTLISIPSLLNCSVKSKTKLYKQLAESIQSYNAEAISTGTLGRTGAQTNDFISASIVSSSCVATTLGDTLSREEAFEISSDLYAIYQMIVAQGFMIQDALTKLLAKNSYQFAPSFFENLAELVGITIGFVDSENYAPSIKKTVVLPSATSPLEFAIDQYPDMEINDAFDFFISTNNLIGNDVILLQAGRTVFVYLR